MEEKKQLTDEQRERLVACESAEEVLAFAKEMGDEFTLEQAAQLFAMIQEAKKAVENGELSDDELDNAAGGVMLSKFHLPWLMWV